MTLPINVELVKGGPNGKIDVELLEGAYVKSITPAGVATVELADGTEDTVTLAITGGGLSAEQVRDTIATMLTEGDNITLAYDDDADTLTITAAAGMTGGLTTEQVQDAVAAMLSEGSNVTLTYDDGAGTLTITAADTDTNTQLSNEQVQDIVAAMLTEGDNITLAYDDAAGTLTITGASGGTGSSDPLGWGAGSQDYRINDDATTIDSQSVPMLGGIYQVGDRPIVITEAVVPVNPDSIASPVHLAYNMALWRMVRNSATSYDTAPSTAGDDTFFRTGPNAASFTFETPVNTLTELHGYVRESDRFVLNPGEYFMVTVLHSEGSDARTIVASGHDEESERDAFSYVAKASNSASAFTVAGGQEFYHNSTFADKQRIIFEFADGGDFSIHDIENEATPTGSDKFPFSDEGETGDPNAAIGYDDLVGLVRGIRTYSTSRPQASAALEGYLALSLISREADICVNVPNRTSEATGTFANITPGTAIEYVNGIENVATPVVDRFYYDYFRDDFYFGTDVGGGTIQLIQDVADDALASFLTSSSNRVVWLHDHATDAAALMQIPSIAATSEYFYWSTAEDAVRKLDNSSYTAAGTPTTSDHFQWRPIIADSENGGGGDATGDSAPVVLFDGPDTPATYVPNVAARPNFRALVLTRAPAENRSLQVEIEVNTNSNTTANPTPTGAVTILTSDHIETNHLVGGDALSALAGAQLTTFSASGNQGPSVGNTTESKIARGNENDANDFGHSNIFVGHGLNADGDFVLYVAHSHWGGMPAHKIRVIERAFGGTTTSEAETGGGQRRVARSVISSGTHLAITPRTFNPDTGAPGFAFSAVSIDDVPIADLDSFSATIRIGDRAGFTMYLSKEQIEYAGRQNDTVWEFTDANNYTDGSVIPCLFLEGKHNTDNYMRTSIKPTRAQVGYIAGSNDGLTGVLIFFVYDPSNENINHVWTVAFSDVDVEVEEMHFHYFEDA